MTTQTTVLPPAISLPLTGQHLIEASAGTGKTWTLTGVVLRLLVEAGYPCDKIIATTFTRSAAAEMRQRIRERLQSFYRLLRLIHSEGFIAPTAKATDDTDNATNSTSNDARYQAFWAWLNERAKRMNLTESLDDPINHHLIDWVAKQVFQIGDSEQPQKQLQTQQDQSQTESTDTDTTEKSAKSSKSNKPNRPPTVDFRIALQRTSLALNQLDRLFVSTLDSLCQKWLREFSSETGFSPEVQISNDVQAVVTGMIHDQLRAFWSHIDELEPQVYRLMQATGKLYDTASYVKVVEKALTFYTAPIDTLRIHPVDLSAIPALMQRIANRHDEAFKPYLDADFRINQGMAKAKWLHKGLASFAQLQQQLASGDVLDLLKLADDPLKLLLAIHEFDKNDDGFNSKKQAQVEAFRAVPMVQDLVKLAKAKLQIEQHITQLNQYFTQFIGRYVREQLPQVLEAQRLTTFSLQLARLNQALASQQGEALARYIRHQYPVALIDESQDINTEQALLIKRIYLDEAVAVSELGKKVDKDKTDKHSQNKGFLLLVGDPKQAIYGFRGGDVHNYTTLKQLFHTKPLALTQNRRSSKALIDSLNAWYGVANQANDNEGDNNDDKNSLSKYNETTAITSDFLGQGIYYQAIEAVRKEASLVLQTDENSLEQQKSILDNEVLAENDIAEPLTEATSDLPTFYQLHIPYKQPFPTEADTAGEDTDKAIADTDVVRFENAIVAEILALFDNSSLSLDKRALSLSDICVLAVRNKELDSLERTLLAHGIATIRGGNQSVFSDRMAQDLLTLMAVLLTPYHQAKVKSLLMSAFFQLNLQEANALLESQEPSEGSHIKQLHFNQLQDMLVQASEYWQKEGFLVAVQWWLNQPLAVGSETIALSFWQRLAKDRAGERLLIDLRQLLDILAQRSNGQSAGQGTGEYQLYEWYERQIQTQPKDDWAIQQRLSSEVGVQLMTIHQSKGLEFAVVFVVGLSEAIYTKKPNQHLYLYTDTHNQQNSQQNNSLLTRRLSPTATSWLDGDIGGGQDFDDIENQSLFEERLRLMYVAVTRARERLYIVTQARNSKSSGIPLTAFVEDCKDFVALDARKAVLMLKDTNSLSKYLNKDQKFTTNPSQSLANNLITKINYAEYQQALTQHAFVGWANTSFTALSRYVNHDKQDSMVHEADYVYEADILEVDNSWEQDEPYPNNPIAYTNLPIEMGIEPVQFDPISNSTGNIEPNFSPNSSSSQPSNLPSNFPPISDDMNYADMPLDIYADFDNEGRGESHGFDTDEPNWQIGERDLSYLNDSYLNDNYPNDYDDMNGYDMGGMDYYDVYQDFSFVEPMPIPEMPLAGELLEMGVQQLPTDDEQKTLLRFNFEKGTSAGVFLHKVLEDLANSWLEEEALLPTNSEWQPPKRWAVVIDRALRKQQLPEMYYSTLASSEGTIGKLDTTDAQDPRHQLQPQYRALSVWLNEVIHTPLGASAQRPVDIRPQQKIAEMGFSMRLNGELSLTALNELFAEYHIPLQLQSQHSKSAIWQYLKGEIDLVYQQDDKFYLVDYKSNYLGNNFREYATDRLVKAMNEHSYWLQASIYQVALHRYLQLRLPNYAIEQHLGAVEYAFIRGMSPYAHLAEIANKDSLLPNNLDIGGDIRGGLGRLVWQPPVDFILALDKLFG
ncbi:MULTISPECIES: UvrD-helicase domain-containing protein [unclassified Moraxella]|uniref:UvrD-helicase domain-containing protein n=1 Tax=unclassified Moraxella TaxID=2685852 RepID=UPI003AF8E52C